MAKAAEAKYRKYIGLISAKGFRASGRRQRAFRSPSALLRGRSSISLMLYRLGGFRASGRGQRAKVACQAFRSFRDLNRRGPRAACFG